MAKSEVSSKKVTAGLLGIFFGWLGVHKFYLGNTTAGIIQILLICTFFGAYIGLIEGIIYLLKSDEDFERLYLIEKKAWF